jgi:serine/threonine protein kinase
MCDLFYVTHRDYKPSNLFYYITAQGEVIVKVADTGAAYTLNKINTGHTKVGTPGWLPEEALPAASGQSIELRANMDSYGFGLVVGFVHTGLRPDQWENLDPDNRQAELRSLLDEKADWASDKWGENHVLRKLPFIVRDLIWRCSLKADERPTLQQLHDTHPYFLETLEAAEGDQDPHGLEGPDWLETVRQLKRRGPRAVRAAAAQPDAMQE